MQRSVAYRRGLAGTEIDTYLDSEASWLLEPIDPLVGGVCTVHKQYRLRHFLCKQWLVMEKKGKVVKTMRGNKNFYDLHLTGAVADATLFSLSPSVGNPSKIAASSGVQLWCNLGNGPRYLHVTDTLIHSHIISMSHSDDNDDSLVAVSVWC